ncbi:hypothetical protein M153_505000626, partial [Pseudoloma neurophilia]
MEYQKYSNKNKLPLFKRSVYHKMNSSKWSARAKDGNDNSVEKKLTNMMQSLSLEKFSFKTRVGESEGPTITIEKLEDHENQEVDQWCKKFKKVCILSNIESKVAEEYLTLMTNERYHEVLEKGTSVEEKIKKLKESVYNENLKTRTFEKLDQLTVGKFESIRGYATEFERLVKKINLCLPKIEKLTKRETEEKFRNGLSNWMKEEMTR